MKLHKNVLFVLASLVLPAASFTLTSCETTNNSSIISSSEGPSEYIDYVNSDSSRLTVDYKGHNFLEDGVGQVTLKTTIDGDTAHFYNAPDGEENRSEVIKIRFGGIDTPESTGRVEEYGRGASNFTKEKLEEAAENGTIVITTASAVYDTPKFDSTGERYLGLVWVNTEKKDCDYDELSLLNLWIVQEGWSYVKNVAEIPLYADNFYAAEQQSRDYKLNLFSGEPDPLFNYGEYTDVSLLDLKNEIIKQIEAESNGESYTNKYDNTKLRIVGTVAGFSNHILYIQNYYENEDGTGGEYAGINFFVGMNQPPSKYITPNAYIQVCGLGLDSDQFGFQLSDGNFPIVSSSENDAKVLISAADNTEEQQLHVFEYVPSELKNDDYSALNCAVKLTEAVRVSGGYVNDAGTELTLYLEDLEGNDLDYDIYLSDGFIYYPDRENYPGLTWRTLDDFVGKEFNIQGVYTYHTFSSGRVGFQIVPTTSDDIEYLGELDIEV